MTHIREFLDSLSLENKWRAFAILFDELGKEMVKTTEDRGFDPKNLDISAMLMNQVSEIAEAHEAYRCGNPPSEKIPAFSHLEEEEADALLRIMIDASAKNWCTVDAAIAKDQYNQKRSKMHGGKKF